MALRQGLRKAFPSLLDSCSLASQRRLVGNLPVKPNKHIEDFASRRETIEKEFRWDRTTLTRIGLWGVVAPYVIYHLMYVESELQRSNVNNVLGLCVLCCGGTI